MNSALSIFTDRLRDYITIYSDEPESFSPPPNSDLARHYDAEFNAMALVLFALQFSHNAHYRRFCEARQIFPNAVSHWTEIPPAPASAFKDLELTCLSPEQRTSVFHSSGTTGHRPSRHFHSPESIALYEHALWPWFRIHVLADRWPSALCNFPLSILAPPPGQAPLSSLVHMFDVIRQRMNAPDTVFLGSSAADNSWALDLPAALESLRNAAAQNDPLMLLGTAFSLVHLLDHLAERKLVFALPPGSRVMETGGYKGRARQVAKSDLHALIAARLGIPAGRIVSEYGMSELSSQAYDLEAREGAEVRTPFRFPPWVRVQITSPETGREVESGESGLIRVFDLANVFSVLAVQTEDVAIRRQDGFELLGRQNAAEPRGCSLMDGPES